MLYIMSVIYYNYVIFIYITRLFLLLHIVYHYTTLYYISYRRYILYLCYITYYIYVMLYSPLSWGC